MQIFLVVAILLFNFAGNLSNDIFLLTLPSLERIFQVSSSLVKQSYSIWFLGAALGQIPAALLMKIFNRRKIVFVAAILFFTGTAIGAFSSVVVQLIIGRFLQGLSFAFCNVYTLVEVQHSFSLSGQERLYSVNGIFNNLSPLVGPIIGAWLLTKFGWYYNFFFIMFLAFILSQILIIIIRSKKKMMNAGKVNLVVQVKDFFQTYKEVFGNAKLLIALSGPALSISCGVSYLMFAPYIFMNDYGVSVNKFCYCQVIIMTGYVVGVVFSLYIAQFDVIHRIKYGSIWTVIIGMSLAVSGIIGVQNLNWYIVLIWLLQFGLGYSYNALMLNSMSKVADTSAAASISCMMTAFFCVLYTSFLCLLSFNKFIIIGNIAIYTALLIKWIAVCDEQGERAADS